MQKAVFKLELGNEKTKKKVLETVNGFQGIDSIAIDMDDETLTVIGDIDAVNIGKKLRKICSADIVWFGPAEEPKDSGEDSESS